MITVTNPHTRRQINEFMDKDHAVMQEYYHCLENAGGKKFMQNMKRIIKSDPSFLDPYLVLSDFLPEKESRELIEEAYKRALMAITDHKGRWPKHMEWGWLENRHIMRAIEYYAEMIWERGKAEEALEVFRNLLRTNPRDNQGARYSILAIRLGLGPDWDEQFIVKKGPMAGRAMEAGPVMEWFEKNAKKFPEEFHWLFKQWEEYER